jgi:chemotaxis protein methyltransferase CheR
MKTPDGARQRAGQLRFGNRSSPMSALLSRRDTPEPAREAEFSFDAADFERVRKLIYQRAGISLHAGKQAMVYSRLSRRLRELGHRSFGSYLQWLEAATGAAGEPEWQEFVNCLTTNLTSFFREEHHFPVLAAELARRNDSRPRLWCNAASTGEEPYSLAMTVIEALGARTDVKILATDIDTKVLASAERGVYAADARGLGPERLRQHFLRGNGANDGSIRVKPELRRLVDFHAHNLMDERWSLGEPFDIVFCRNVMIYFDAPTQRRVLERMHRAMRPHGLLFAGHSENFNTSRDLFRLRGKTVYERV